MQTLGWLEVCVPAAAFTACADSPQLAQFFIIVGTMLGFTHSVSIRKIKHNKDSAGWTPCEPVPWLNPDQPKFPAWLALTGWLPRSEQGAQPNAIRPINGAELEVYIRQAVAWLSVNTKFTLPYTLNVIRTVDSCRVITGEGGGLRTAEVLHLSLSLGWCIGKSYLSSLFSAQADGATVSRVLTMHMLAERALSQCGEIARVTIEASNNKEIVDDFFTVLSRGADSKGEAAQKWRASVAKQLKDVLALEFFVSDDAAIQAQRLVLFNKETANLAHAAAKMDDVMKNLIDKALESGLQSSVSVLGDNNKLPDYLSGKTNRDPFTQALSICTQHSRDEVRRWRSTFSSAESQDLQVRDALFTFLDTETPQCYANASIVDKFAVTATRLDELSREVVALADSIAASSAVLSMMRVAKQYIEEKAVDAGTSGLLDIEIGSRGVYIARARIAATDARRIGMRVYGESLGSRATYIARMVSRIASDTESRINLLRDRVMADAESLRHEVGAIRPAVAYSAPLPLREATNLNWRFANLLERAPRNNPSGSIMAEIHNGKRVNQALAATPEKSAFASSVLSYVRCAGVVDAVSRRSD